MESGVENSIEIKREVEANNELMDEIEEEPSEEGTTTDKSDTIDAKSNHIETESNHIDALSNHVDTFNNHIDTKSDPIDTEAKEPNDDGTQNDELIQGGQVKQEPDENGQNGDNKQDNQEVEEEDEDEEEVEDKDEEVDKMENEKSTKDTDNQESSQLGRNRRVRQKNRYFLDFHCIDLTKGARANRDDPYDSFATTTSTRSSNRRSTTDSTKQDEPEVFESRYCRKCSSKTPHDFDGGCQACLYKKIVESSKRQKPSSQRNRSATTKQQQDNELGSTSTTPASISNKRKSNKQGGSKNKYLNQKYRNIPDLRNNSDSSSNDNNPTPRPQIQTQPQIQHQPQIQPQPQQIQSELSPPEPINTSIGGNSDLVLESSCSGSGGNNKLPKLDSWTPDEVAEYIMSKGFAQEAELFKTQSVDGISLLLMQRTDFTYGLKIKLGPALKIYDQVCKLKREYLLSSSLNK